MALADFLAVFTDSGGFYFRSGAFFSRLSHAGEGRAVISSGFGSAGEPA